MAEPRDINGNILLDLDEHGQRVGMTIDHADAQANLSEISFQQLTKKGSSLTHFPKRVSAHTTSSSSFFLAVTFPLGHSRHKLLGIHLFPSCHTCMYLAGIFPTPSQSVIPVGPWQKSVLS